MSRLITSKHLLGKREKQSGGNAYFWEAVAVSALPDAVAAVSLGGIAETAEAMEQVVPIRVLTSQARQL
jgi:hypothetical protein